MLHMIERAERRPGRMELAHYWLILDDNPAHGVAYHPCGHFCRMIMCCACSAYPDKCEICAIKE